MLYHKGLYQIIKLSKTQLKVYLTDNEFSNLKKIVIEARTGTVYAYYVASSNEKIKTFNLVAWCKQRFVPY